MAFKFEGKWIDVEVHSGRAFEISHSNKTEYSQRYVPLANGTILTSSERDLTTFWLDRPDLPPRQFKFHAAIPILNDHPVKILYLGWRDKKTMAPAAIFNGKTKQLFMYSPEKLSSLLNLSGDTGLGILSAILSVISLVIFPFISMSIFQHKINPEPAGWIGFGFGAAWIASQLVYNSIWKARRLAKLKAGLTKETLEGCEFGSDFPQDVSLITLNPDQ